MVIHLKYQCEESVFGCNGCKPKLIGLKSSMAISALNTVLIVVLCCVFVFSYQRKGKKGNAKHPQKTPEEVREILLKHEIIPDVIDSCEPHVLKVGYTQAGKVVNFGNTITREEAREAPTSLSWPTNNDAFYSLMMIDPDYPDRETHELRSWQNWLIVNITGSNILRGTVLTEYIGVEAPKGTGSHRYVFLVFQQPNEIEFTEEMHTIAVPVDSLRAPFRPREFMKTYNMTGPVAVNFFVSQYGRLYPAVNETED